MFTLPSTEDMSIQDWVWANNYMTRSAFAQLKRKATLGGIPIPLLFAGRRPSRITFETLSETAQYQRVQNTESLNKFNNEVEAWAKKIESLLKASAQSKFNHRPTDKVTALQPRLADSIRANVIKDKKHKLEARSIGFSIARHGVYLQKGAGVAHGGVKGSKWVSKKMNWVKTDPESLGKMDTGNREAVDWFNDIIDSNLEELLGIVADYSLDIIVSKSGMLIS